jgi:hypothetical protein
VKILSKSESVPSNFEKKKMAVLKWTGHIRFPLLVSLHVAFASLQIFAVFDDPVLVPLYLQNSGIQI